MDNNSDSSTSVTDEEDDENVDKVEIKSTESAPNKSPKDQSKDSTDEPIMDEQQQTVGVSKHQFEEDKKAVYKHPLFPLLALLLEKCELATSTLNSQSISSTSSSFNSEIAAFVQHQQRDGKPFLSDDPEVDALMIKAIQVLRIHLLELEKVSELCKDFCHRYITCLRTKMSSENLLRGTSCVDPNSGHSSANSFDGSSCSSDAESDDFPLTSSSTTYASATPQTVYHMVQTAQGLVAQPIQLSSSQTSIGSSASASISQIAANNNNSSNKSNNNNKSNHINSRTDSSNDDDLSDDLGPNYSQSKKKQQKRGVLPKQATSVMRSWLFQHIVHPYPTEDEKRAIASQTNLTLLQVNNWFINARRRILQPMLDTANSLNESQGAQGQNTSKAIAKGSCSSKKLKTSNSVQRFWPQSIANAIQGISQKEDSK